MNLNRSGESVVRSMWLRSRSLSWLAGQLTVTAIKLIFDEVAISLPSVS